MKLTELQGTTKSTINDIYYSLLSREELVEKDGAPLLLQTERLASAAQFDEMSPVQQHLAEGRPITAKSTECPFRIRTA